MIDVDAPREVEEWIGRTPSQPVPPRVALRQFIRDKGACRHCGRKLGPADKPQCDHVTAIVNGGANREANLQTLCQWCHVAKTKTDVAAKAKTYRVLTRHVGLRKAKQPIRGWRRFNGQPVINPKLERRS